MTGILIGLAGAVGLTRSASVGVLTPWLILAFTFTIGCSVALFGPAWQASVAEQVPPAHLGEAVALNSISYNVARSFGPAIGGFIVAAAGATAAFLVNAIFFRSEEHTSELQSLMRISYAVFCLKQKTRK